MSAWVRPAEGTTLQAVRIVYSAEPVTMTYVEDRTMMFSSGQEEKIRSMVEVAQISVTTTMMRILLSIASSLGTRSNNSRTRTRVAE
jgi:hypothetical protein